MPDSRKSNATLAAITDSTQVQEGSGPECWKGQSRLKPWMFPGVGEYFLIPGLRFMAPEFIGVGELGGQISFYMRRQGKKGDKWLS